MHSCWQGQDESPVSNVRLSAVSQRITSLPSKFALAQPGLDRGLCPGLGSKAYHLHFCMEEEKEKWWPAVA